MYPNAVIAVSRRVVLLELEHRNMSAYLIQRRSRTGIVKQQASPLARSGQPSGQSPFSPRMVFTANIQSPLIYCCRYQSRVVKYGRIYSDYPSIS